MPIDSFLNYLSLEKKYSKHTTIAYKNDLNSFQTFCRDEYGEESIIRVNYAQIRTWIVSLVNDKISNRTINRKISSLKSFYKFLRKTKQIEINPLVKHQALKVSKHIQVPFSEREILDVLNSFDKVCNFESIRNKLIVELFYSTGIRRSELINLTISNIDFSNETVKVFGKRNKELYIPLIKAALKSLNKYIEFRSNI